MPLEHFLLQLVLYPSTSLIWHYDGLLQSSFGLLLAPPLGDLPFRSNWVIFHVHRSQPRLVFAGMVPLLGCITVSIQFMFEERIAMSSNIYFQNELLNYFKKPCGCACAAVSYNYNYITMSINQIKLTHRSQLYTRSLMATQQ